MTKDIDLFNRTTWSVIDDNKLLIYNIAKGEGHDSGIKHFAKDHGLDIKDGTSFEMSVELASRDYICFHSSPSNYLITFMPSVLTNKGQIDTLTSVIPHLKEFNDTQAIVYVNPDGTFYWTEEFDWDKFRPNSKIETGKVLSKVS